MSTNVPEGTPEVAPEVVPALPADVERIRLAERQTQAVLMKVGLLTVEFERNKAALLAQVAETEQKHRDVVMRAAARAGIDHETQNWTWDAGAAAFRRTG